MAYRAGPRLDAALIVAALSVALPCPAAAIDLQPGTNRAFDAYVEQATRAFIARVRSDAAPRIGQDGDVSAAPARDDGIIEVPGGLVHHWVGSAFVRGVTLQRVVDISSAYPAYSKMYTAVVASTLLGREKDRYRVRMRLKEGDTGVSAVLDVRSTIDYVYPTTRSAYALSRAEEIREVVHAGEPGEHLLPAGRDSGYLWRANTFTRFVRHEDGVYVEMETIGLSREFPPLLGWIIEPIARRLGRRSVETSLQEFLAAVRAARTVL